jgi:hypothetical protein
MRPENLIRKRTVFDERLPDGKTVYEATAPKIVVPPPVRPRVAMNNDIGDAAAPSIPLNPSVGLMPPAPAGQPQSPAQSAPPVLPSMWGLAPSAPDVGAVPSPAASATRQRYAEGEPEELTKLVDYNRQLRTAPLYNDARDPATGAYKAPEETHRPSRGRAFLQTALLSLGSAMSRAQAQAAAEGRRADWGDFAAGLAGAAGAGVVGAVDRSVPLRMRREAEIARTQGQIEQETALRANAANLQNLEARPFYEAARLRQQQTGAVQSARRAEIADLLTMHGRAGHYNPSDPNDSASQLLKRESDRLGIQLVPYEKNQKDAVPPRTEIEGVTYERTGAGKWAPAAGLPVDRGKVLGPDMLTPGQRAMAGERAEVRTQAATNRVEDRTIADQRYEQGRYEADEKEAANYYQKMENARTNAKMHADAARDLFNLGASLPNDKNRDQRMAELKAKAEAELRAEQAAVADMQTSAEQLRRFPHIYQVGGQEGANGLFYPSASRLPRAPAPPPTRSAPNAPLVRRTGGGKGAKYVPPQVPRARLEALMR